MLGAKEIFDKEIKQQTKAKKAGEQKKLSKENLLGFLKCIQGIPNTLKNSEKEINSDGLFELQEAINKLSKASFNGISVDQLGEHIEEIKDENQNNNISKSYLWYLKAEAYYYLSVIDLANQAFVMNLWLKAALNYCVATELNPEFVAAWNGLGKLNSNEDRYDSNPLGFTSKKALEYYEKALAQNEKCVITLINMAHYYNSQNKHKDVIDYCTKAILLSHKDENLFILRGEAYKYLGKSKKALNDINKAIEFNPEKASSYVAKAKFFEKTKEYEFATQQYLKAAELVHDLKCKVVYYHRVWYLYRELKQYAKGLQVIEKILELNSKDAMGLQAKEDCENLQRKEESFEQKKGESDKYFEQLMREEKDKNERKSTNKNPRNNKKRKGRLKN